jgi:hypothetical protein
MAQRPKRPRDLNQWAKRMVDIATGEAKEAEPEADKDAAAVRGGIKGGAARAAKLSSEERVAIARKAATARWKREQN